MIEKYISLIIVRVARRFVEHRINQIQITNKFIAKTDRFKNSTQLFLSSSHNEQNQYHSDIKMNSRYISAY